jgi:hypothetical protein
MGIEISIEMSGEYFIKHSDLLHDRLDRETSV